MGDRRTVAGPAASAVRVQTPPAFHNLGLVILPNGLGTSTAFALDAPLHYKTYDQDGKLVLEGDFKLDADNSVFSSSTVLSPTWNLDNRCVGSFGSDPRDTMLFELHLRPQHLPPDDIPR